MRIGVVGINYRLAELKLREALARACQRRFAPSHIHPPEHTFILLSTCNRTEVYFCSDNLAESQSYLINILRNDIQEEFDQKLYSFFGPDCFHHLCRVTAGLDSAIVAETEIQGQVKIAYEKTVEQIPIPSDLHFLFQKSLQVGKKVRSRLPLQRGIPSLEHAILNAAEQSVLQRALDTPILFLGASDINFKILKFLKQKGFSNITLCNRTDKVAEDYAAAHGIVAMPWKEFSRWGEFDWIIAGTKAQEPLISKDSVPQDFVGKKVIFDLSVPRNVDPNVIQNPHITLWNIDQLNNMLQHRREKMNTILHSAEQVVAESTENYLYRFQKREYKVETGYKIASA
jgi:glutamyl-tRNA reductase